MTIIIITDEYRNECRSIEWLKTNYHHIWDHPELNSDQKAGFLAAACNPLRCFLMTYSLEDRIQVIRAALP